jgi:hypothetical protein
MMASLKLQVLDKKQERIELIEPKKTLLISGEQTKFEYFESLENERGPFDES